mgnify:CR=1 FL=1
MVCLSTIPRKYHLKWQRKRSTKVEFSVPGESLDYFFFNGPDLKDVLRRYTDLNRKTGTSSGLDIWPLAFHVLYDKL